MVIVNNEFMTPRGNILSKGRRIRGKETAPSSLNSTIIGLKESEEEKPFRYHRPSKTVDFSGNNLPLEV